MAKGNFIEYIVSDDPNKYPNDGERGDYYYEAIEDVTPEVTAQTPMISQILSNLGFTADSASGTNKQKLQTNNANLAKISDYLPHGAYVWKKYDKREFSANVNTISTGFTLYLFNHGNSDYVGDFSFVDEDYLIGTVINLNVEATEDITLTLLPNNKVDCQSASIDSWSYSKTTRTITFSSSDIYGNSISLLLNSANFNHFLSYVTAEDISKYPDGAVHTDGYWYEKVVEGIAGIDFGEVTLNTAVNTVTVNHNLGVVPSFVALIPKELASETGSLLININGKAIRRTTSSWYVSTVTNTVTDTSIVFGQFSSAYKYPAKNYYWIAIL